MNQFPQINLVGLTVNPERFPDQICSTDICASSREEGMWPKITKEIGL